MRLTELYSLFHPAHCILLVFCLLHLKKKIKRIVKPWRKLFRDVNIFIMQHSIVAFLSVFLTALPGEETIKLTGAESNLRESNLSCVYCGEKKKVL